MLVEIDDDTLSFQAISREGLTIDAGTLFQHGEPHREGRLRRTRRTIRDRLHLRLEDTDPLRDRVHLGEHRAS